MKEICSNLATEWILEKKKSCFFEAGDLRSLAEKKHRGDKKDIPRLKELDFCSEFGAKSNKSEDKHKQVKMFTYSVLINKLLQD